MTVKEAAATLRITDRRVRSLVAEGRLAAMRPGERMLLVSRASVEAESSRRLHCCCTRGRKSKTALAS
ncbi:MAG: helix-turn-helix domain-containing protein [Armatimonadota bacterium]